VLRVWQPQFSPSPTLIASASNFTVFREEIGKCGLEQKLDKVRRNVETSTRKRVAWTQNDESETGDSSSLTSTQEWLTTREAASYLGLSTGALLNMTSNGEIPHYKLGKRRNRYRVTDLRELLLARKRGSSL
jgi:excisionase family DNA binding protein